MNVAYSALAPLIGIVLFSGTPVSAEVGNGVPLYKIQLENRIESLRKKYKECDSSGSISKADRAALIGDFLVLGEPLALMGFKNCDKHFWSMLRDSPENYFPQWDHSQVGPQKTRLFVRRTMADGQSVRLEAAAPVVFGNETYIAIIDTGATYPLVISSLDQAGVGKSSPYFVPDEQITRVAHGSFSFEHGFKFTSMAVVEAPNLSDHLGKSFVAVLGLPTMLRAGVVEMDFGNDEFEFGNLAPLPRYDYEFDLFIEAGRLGTKSVIEGEGGEKEVSFFIDTGMGGSNLVPNRGMCAKGTVGKEFVSSISGVRGGLPIRTSRCALRISNGKSKFDVHANVVDTETYTKVFGGADAFDGKHGDSSRGYKGFDTVLATSFFDNFSLVRFDFNRMKLYLVK